MGATQASAGVLAPYIEMRDSTPLLGPAVRSLDLYDEFIRGLSAENGVPIQYRRTGTIDLALNDEEQAEPRRHGVRDFATRCGRASHGRASGPIGRTARQSRRHSAACWSTAHGFVAPTTLTRALAESATRHGARMLAPARVQSIAQRGAGTVVTTDKSSIACGSVVLAAGSWSGRIDIDGVRNPAPVKPVRGQLLTLKWPDTRLRRVTWSSGCYLVPWDDGTVLLGGTVEDVGFDERATVAGVNGLLGAARLILPVAESAEFTGARVGLRPGTADGLPIIGRSRAIPSLVYATGHYRNGILLTPLTATLVADILLENRVDPMLAPFAPERFGVL